MTTIDSIRDALLAAPHVRIAAGRTKPALSAPPEDATTLDLSPCRGITDYQPGEFIITARAGTPLAEIDAALAEHGQYLPFDPPFVAQGATLGGTIAAGLSGSGRLRFGGLRDFIIGTTFLTGDGRLVHGGGKVVKNAAGFDFPKLLTGSCGRLGVILDATFKVFPRPQEHLTASTHTGSLAAALDLAARLVRLPADLEALDFDPDGRLSIRLAGDRGTLKPRLDRLARESGSSWTPDDTAAWPDGIAHREGLGFVKVPVTPPRIPELDAAVAAIGVPRRYAVAGHLAWIAIGPGQASALDGALRACRLAGLSLHQPPSRLGLWPSPAAELMVRHVFDPAGRLV
ncbi:MAG: FAD-binding protein [Verrucomicrobiales bacterium]